MGQGCCQLLGVLLQGLGALARQGDAFALALHLVGREQRFPERCSGNWDRGGSAECSGKVLEAAVASRQGPSPVR